MDGFVLRCIKMHFTNRSNEPKVCASTNFCYRHWCRCQTNNWIITQQTFWFYSILSKLSIMHFFLFCILLPFLRIALSLSDVCTTLCVFLSIHSMYVWFSFYEKWPTFWTYCTFLSIVVVFIIVIHDAMFVTTEKFNDLYAHFFGSFFRCFF